MIRSILVPLDGSPFGEHALPLAAWIARRAPAHLHLVRVHQPIPAMAVEGIVIPGNIEQALRQDEKAYLTGVVGRLRDEVGLPADAALLDGDIATAICDGATAAKADLVVLCTHGRGTLGRFWLGSVADELIRLLPMPVLLVRPTEGPVDLNAPPTIERILLPLDGTPLAEQMIEPAFALGKMMDATIALVRVIKPATQLAYLHETMHFDKEADSILHQIRTLEDHLRVDAKAYLDRVAAGLRGRDVRVETHVMADEQPAVGILREASSFAADLIALETHGRRGLSRVLMGSVADKVIRGGHLPVLLHRPSEA